MSDWLLLIHQIPPKPDYLRVKVGRRLQRIGSVAVKNSVYVLPDRDPSLEDFQWVRSEIVDAGGDAWLCRAAFVDGLTEGQLEQLFRDVRDADYAEITLAARELRGELRHRDRGASARPEDDIARLRKRFAAVVSIDFFAAAGKAAAADALEAVARELGPGERESGDALVAQDADRLAYRGRTWVTRAGVFVDRMASAWLIRRFIDRDAHFRFVDPAKHRPVAGELRFDMFEGEFTHEGDRCTFETLLARFRIDDPALHAIGEIVHDIDLKDDKFGRDDSAGIERVFAGIAAANPDDSPRLDRSAGVLDDLYALFARQADPSRSSISSVRNQSPIVDCG